MYIELNYPYNGNKKINNIFLLITGIHKKKNLKKLCCHLSGTVLVHSHFTAMNKFQKSLNNKKLQLQGNTYYYRRTVTNVAD